VRRRRVCRCRKSPRGNDPIAWRAAHPKQAEGVTRQPRGTGRSRRQACRGPLLLSMPSKGLGTPSLVSAPAWMRASHASNRRRPLRTICDILRGSGLAPGSHRKQAPHDLYSAGFGGGIGTK
jgi:hypothetical protein